MPRSVYLEEEPRHLHKAIEGFATLSTGIKRRLDDGFPMLMEGLVDMLWPRFLEPVPETCVVVFAPRPGTLHGSHTIGTGTKASTGTVAAALTLSGAQPRRGARGGSQRSA